MQQLHLHSRVHNAKAEKFTTPIAAECTTPYMCWTIGVGQGGLHGNQLAKNSPTKIKLGIECASKYLERWAVREVGWHMAAIAIAGC